MARTKTVREAAILAVAFAKAEANGNDFVIVDGAIVPSGCYSAFAVAVCDRQRGIGADGVEFVEATATGMRLQLFNADGTRAEISGNGTRCVVAVVAERDGFRVGKLQTGAGPRRAVVAGGGDGAWDIEIDMDVPGFLPAEIPMLGLPAGTRRVRAYDLTVGARKHSVSALSMGNPHCCLLGKGFPPDWQALGRRISSHRAFPQQTNVEFVRLLSRHRIEVRLFERGVGPTLSSGTGCCAAAVAAIDAGLARSPLEVQSPGGLQTVSWREPDGAVQLRGPARVIAHGVYYFHAAAG